MNVRRLTLVIATAAALAPLISQASPGTDSANACARTLAASMAGNDAAPPAYRLKYRASRFSGSVADYYLTDYQFDLEAHDAKTGAVIARARCSTNARGVIVGFSTLPLADQDAILSAQR
jgi:hypothetical protein